MCPPKSSYIDAAAMREHENSTATTPIHIRAEPKPRLIARRPSACANRVPEMPVRGPSSLVESDFEALSILHRILSAFDPQQSTCARGRRPPRVEQLAPV